jgi:hypothetical protein
LFATTLSFLLVVASMPLASLLVAVTCGSLLLTCKGPQGTSFSTDAADAQGFDPRESGPSLSASERVWSPHFDAGTRAANDSPPVEFNFWGLDQ